MLHQEYREIRCSMSLFTSKVCVILLCIRLMHVNNFRCTTLPFDIVTIHFSHAPPFCVLKTSDEMKVPSSTSKIQEEVYIASVPKNRLCVNNQDIAACMHTIQPQIPVCPYTTSGETNSVSTIGE